MSSALSLGLALGLLAAPLAGQLSSSLLLRAHTLETSTFECSAFEYDLFIGRDGQVVETAALAKGPLLVNQAKARPEAVAALRQVLQDSQIGQAAGGCGVNVFEPEVFRAVTITWYGAPPRQHTFSVTELNGPPCPPATDALYLAIRQFRATTFAGDPEARGAVFPLPPQPLCAPPAASTPPPPALPRAQ